MSFYIDKLLEHENVILNDSLNNQLGICFKSLITSKRNANRVLDTLPE